MTDIEIAVPVKKSPRKPRPSEIAAKKAKTKKPIKKAKAKTNGTGKKKTIGRPFMYPDMTLVRMPKDTLKRIHSALKADEGQADFMRTSVMTELKRRRK